MEQESVWWNVGLIGGALVLLLGGALAARAVAANRNWQPKIRDQETLAKELRKVAQKHRQPAMAAAVVRGGETVASAAVGVTVDGGEQRVTPESRFHLGSTTKGMTALLIALLVRDGQLAYEDALDEVLPDVPMRDDYRRVTIRDLLLHRAGIVAMQERDKEDPSVMGRLWDELPAAIVDPQAQRAEMARIVLGVPPRDPVGTKHVYSNVGYCLLGHVAEVVTGISFETLLATRIFEPLGMRSARLGGWPASLADPDQPRGHYVEAGKLRAQTLDDAYTFPAWMSPAGGAHCSIGDFGLYAREVLRGLQGRGALLDREGYAVMHAAHATVRIAEMYEPSLDALRAAYGSDLSEATTTIGFGWGVVTTTNGPISLGDGSGGTFFARIVVFPGLDVALVAATSAGSGSAAIADIMKKATGLSLQ